MSESNRTPALMLQEHIVGLAPVVHWLGAHPELQFDTVSIDTLATDTKATTKVDCQVSSFHPDAGDRFADAARALAAGAPIGTVKKSSDQHYTRVARDFGAVTLDIWTMRDVVCERVVVGTETVEIPDPDAPTVTVEQERTEWRCRPILAGLDTEAVQV